jgi:hypothetical protein
MKSMPLSYIKIDSEQSILEINKDGSFFIFLD